MLIYPNHPDFNSWLSVPPPNWNKHSDEVALVVSPETGMMRPANKKEFFDYAYGGEYEERLKRIGEHDHFS